MKYRKKAVVIDAEAAIRKAKAEGKVEGLREAAHYLEEEWDGGDPAAYLRRMADEAEKEAL